MASDQYTIGLGAMETFCSLLSSDFHGCKRRSRFFQIARRSALECASIHDILLTFEAIDPESIRYRRKLSSTSTRKTDEKKHRTECAPCNVPFFLAPWNPFLASLEIREWKETPSHARASFLGGIGFIGPNASFS